MDTSKIISFAKMKFNRNIDFFFYLEYNVSVNERKDYEQRK